MIEHDDTARAVQIAEYLTLATGEKWAQRADQHGRANIIFGPQLGEHLYIGSANGNPKRIEIHGSLHIGDVNLYTYLRSLDYKPNHTITVSADRAPAAIASAITRRLLPNYRRDLAAGLAAYHAAEAHQRQIEQIAAEIATSLRGRVPNNTRDHTAFYDGLPGCCVRGYVSSAQSITFEISGVDLKTARAIAQAITDHQPTGPA
jgi:hypothetical protein